MPQEVILIVEDEADLAEMLRFNLEREGYRVRCAQDGLTALAEARRFPPDVILLDRMLPGASGDEVIAQLKRDSTTSGIPVIMLTAKADEADALVGFALGADDYVTKPFSVKLLLARVRAMLRRSDVLAKEPEVLTDGPVRLDTGRHEVQVEGAPVPLTSTEFRVLKALMAADGRVLSRAQLIDAALGDNVAVTDRTIDVHITGVRRKLGGAADWVQTIRGVGYTFREP
jgi:two-component system, OmpR family, alkaline phosphatase synthesis response regulator PhoP